MIQFSNFTIALQSSWTRRLITSTDSVWKKMFEIDLHVTIPDLMNFVIQFDKILKNRTRNEF